jgi:predicted TPR repeat methyltransferase
LKPENVSIIDFGCGTGRVGESLYTSGFKKITGIDCSERMLDEAESKNVYTDLDQVVLGSEECVSTFPTALRSKFDFATCAGVIENSMQLETIFEQLLFSLKRDGCFIFTAQFSFLGDFWWTVLLRRMELEGRIKLVHSENFFKYD